MWRGRRLYASALAAAGVVVNVALATDQSISTMPVGVAIGTGQGACAAINDAPAAVGEIVTLVTPNLPQRLMSATLEARRGTLCPMLQQANLPGSVFGIHIAKGELRSGELAIVTRRSLNAFRQRSGEVIGTDAHQPSVYFSTCTGREGIHLSAWSDQPPKAKRLWHTYVYLGYDVDENCTAEESAKDDSEIAR